jgi:hypothetical protein
VGQGRNGPRPAAPPAAAVAEPLHFGSDSDEDEVDAGESMFEGDGAEANVIEEEEDMIRRYDSTL